MFGPISPFVCRYSMFCVRFTTRKCFVNVYPKHLHNSLNKLVAFTCTTDTEMHSKPGQQSHRRGLDSWPHGVSLLGWLSASQICGSPQNPLISYIGSSVHPQMNINQSCSRATCIHFFAVTVHMHKASHSFGDLMFFRCS